MYVVDKQDTPAQAIGLVTNILGKMPNLSKPRVKFMSWLFGAWLGLPVRHTMLNLARFGPYCDRSVRLHFEKSFEFEELNLQLIDRTCGSERIAAFDPCFISKSGRKTYGLDEFWCGTNQQMERGLELGVLSVIDAQARTAFPLRATQTPTMEQLKAKGQNLMDHYLGQIEKQKPPLKQLGIRYVTADAYFAKRTMVDAVSEKGFHLITRLRKDANLWYLYNGPRAKTGRPKIYDEKVHCAHIDKRRLQFFYENGQSTCYSGLVYAQRFKRIVRIVYIQSIKDNKYCILMSTDTDLAPDKIMEYYKLRFQIEFLIRDSKVYAGLEECQARSEEKLDFHFNTALTSVGIAKATCWMSLPAEQRGAFSMRNVQLLFNCRLFTDRVFRNLGLDPSLEKYQAAYNNCINIDDIAA
jgi:hypothetical protein